MLKRLMRSGIRRTRDWLREDPPQPTGWPFHHAYGQLNRIFENLMKEGRHVRPHFAWGLVYGAYLAKSLGIKRISTMELGVAGGNGLLSLEHVALGVERHLGVEIEVYGFDTEFGLPKPHDYRDLPNLYREGAFAMDFDGLRKRLKKAQLILGLVENTVPGLIRSAPAPIAFISFDMDYYSSTMHAFKLFEADHSMLLPRVHCYFDDIIGLTYSEFNGDRLAIAEFNDSHAMTKISPIVRTSALRVPVAQSGMLDPSRCIWLTSSITRCMAKMTAWSTAVIRRQFSRQQGRSTR